MRELLKKPIETLFDKTESLFKRIFILIFIILGLFLINNFFWLSFYYNTTNKIELINQIEYIKKNNSKDYYISTDNLNNLNILEQEIFERKNIFSNIDYYIEKIKIWEIKIKFDLWNILSIQWFWILCLIIMIPTTYKNWFWELLWVIVLIFIMMIIWNFTFKYINWLFPFEMFRINIINYVLNISILIIITIFWNQNRKS